MTRVTTGASVGSRAGSGGWQAQGGQLGPDVVVGMGSSPDCLQLPPGAQRTAVSGRRHSPGAECL